MTYDLDGTLLINGKKLETEQAIAFKESCIGLQNSLAYKVIKEQVAYEAVKMGVFSSVTVEQLILGKAALWVQQQEQNLITKITGESQLN